MLWSPCNDFQWDVSNYGATYTDTGIGTLVTAAITNNNKGTAVELIADTLVTEDVYGVSILFSGGSDNGATRQYLADLLIDSDGGTSYSVVIANLAVNSAHLEIGGCAYYFPLYLKSGTTIGCQIQSNLASEDLRVAVRLYGKPSRPELVKCGTKVETFGATTASTTGTAITPGTSAMGALTASMGTTAHDLFWWQAGLILADTSRGAHCNMMDVLAGDGTNNLVCAEGIPYYEGNTTERGAKGAMGTKPPWRNVGAGNDVFMRSACSTTPESNTSVIAYGLG